MPEPIAGSGGFRQVLADLKRGVPPERTGQASAGIGAAMRIAPLALYFSDDPDAMHESVMAASLMTHRDIRSLAGAMAVAHAVRRLIAGAGRDPSFLFRVAADVARSEERIAREAADSVASLDVHPRSLSQAIANTEALLEIPRERALAALAEEANRHGAEPFCKRATMGFPPACIPACLYLLLTTDSLEEALIEVINLGGDADSTGAILGALAGAHYGVGAIPARWLEGLQNREGVDARAHALAQRSAEGIEIPDLVTTEQALSAQEAACRTYLMTHTPNANGGDLGANRRV
jgi:ADP-ribosyl-[dinitrogen reductase] hydrolase